MEETQNFEVTSVDENLLPFKTELNMGLSMVFEYSKKARNERYERSTVVGWFDKDKAFNRAEIVVSGPNGAPSALDQDVLTVLMSMVVEQKNLVPGFTFAEISNRLGMKKGNIKRIKEVIHRLMDIKIKFKDSFYSLQDQKFREHTVHLINSVDLKKRIDDHSCKSEFHTVRFDERVGDNLIKGYYGLLDRNTYIALPQGAVRRLYQILETRRKLSGDEFTMELTQLGDQLGLTEPTKFKTYIKKYFECLKAEYDFFDYVIVKVDGKNIVKVVCQGPSDARRNRDRFFQSLVEWYEAEEIAKINLGEETLVSLRKNPDFGEIINFGKWAVPRIDLYADVLLFQKTEMKSFVAVLRKCLEKKDIIYPKDYIFIEERLRMRQMDLAKKMALVKREKDDLEKQAKEKQIEELAQSHVEGFRQKNPGKYERLREIAESRLSADDKDSLLVVSLLNMEMVKVVREMMLRGEEV